MARDKVKEGIALYIDRMIIERKIDNLMKGATKEERDAINSAAEKIDTLVKQDQIQVVSAKRPTRRRARPTPKPKEATKQTKKVPSGSRRRRKTK